MDYRDLLVWKIGMDLANLTYKFTETLPESERHNLKRQMRRLAMSIPIAIAEGAACQDDKQFVILLQPAEKALNTLETHYNSCITNNIALENTDLKELIITQRKLLVGFKDYLK